MFRAGGMRAMCGFMVKRCQRSAPAPKEFQEAQGNVFLYNLNMGVSKNRGP